MRFDLLVAVAMLQQLALLDSDAVEARIQCNIQSLCSNFDAFYVHDASCNVWRYVLV